MSDATPKRPDAPALDLQHLERIEAEASRHRQNALWIRAGGVAMVAAFVAWHGAAAQSRYMFFAPMLGLTAWLLDAHAEWNLRALRLLAAAARGELSPRPAPRTLDVTPWASLVSWRSVLLRPARVAYFHPLTTVACYVAVDAPRLDPDGLPSELFWYLAVTFGAFLVAVITAWSWWYDRFGAAPVAYAPPPVTASYQGAPPPLDARAGAAPFEAPVAARTEATKPFGTAVGTSAQ